ncbi:MFS transporter [soil metagenome]
MVNHEPPEESKALNPTVVKLGFVSFLADVASEMLYPVTPIFLTTVLGASMASLGLIEGVAEATASLLKTFAGRASDRMGRRKPFVVVGYLLAALSKPFIGAATSWIHVLLARALDRTGKGLRSAPRDALIADSVSAANCGAAFGWHRGMDTFGAAVGPLLAVYLISARPGDLRSLYYWAIIPGLLSVLVTLTLKETKQKEKKRLAESASKPAMSFLSWREFGPDLKKYVIAWTTFSLTNSSDVFLLMKAKASGLSIQHTILLYCAYNLIYSLSSPYLGILSDRIPRKNILISGLAVFAAVYVGFAFATDTWHFWLLFICYGLYMGATDGVGKALVVDLCEPKRKATALGFLGTTSGLATIFASTAAGLLWDHSGATTAFLFGAAGAVLASVLLLKVTVPDVPAAR